MKKLILLTTMLTFPLFAEEVTFSFNDNSTNEDFFVIQQSVENANSWVDFIIEPITDGTTLGSVSIIGNIVNSGVFDYRVVARNSFGDSGPSNIVTLDHNDVFLPNEPTILSI